MDHNKRVRFSRHIALPEIGKQGQQTLLDSQVLVIGAGGLGSPVLLYLAAAGIGTVGIVDNDVVELSNLQRQVIHEDYDVGQKKVESAKAAMLDRNPDMTVMTYDKRLNADNADSIIAEYDMVVDGSDNITTRYLVNECCFRLKKPLVSAAIQGFSGQLSTFKAYLGEPHPCYQCLYPDVPEVEGAPNCSNAGVLGGVAGLMGVWQSIEVVKELLGIGESISGYLLIVDALKATSRKVKINKEKACSCCGIS